MIAAAVMTMFTAARAQVTTEPAPLQEDTEGVTIFFHADEGNKGLIDMPASTHIYAHTGVNVIDNDGKVTEWKYAPEWDEDLPKYQLEYVSENLWKLYIGDIREFYGVAPDETVTKLCFVFRNTGGTKEGKAEGGGDIFVDVLESGFQMTLSSGKSTNIVNGTNGKFELTVTATEPADIKIYVNDILADETKQPSKMLFAPYTFTEKGEYDIKGVATCNGKTLEKHITILYADDAEALTGMSLPAMGLTKDNDGNYVFCLAAPQKENVLLIGSWNKYQPVNAQVMDYIDQTVDGASFRYFIAKVPEATAGKEFGYYYLVDYKKAVGDPYARLVLDPYNDKYIPASVYPDMPEYPQGLVPDNTLIAWHSESLLDYKWNTTDFKPAPKDNLVIYEMLFRDFTGTEGKAEGNGTVRKAIEKLPYLKKLGINAVELLPINEFNGNISWGYNPNFYFAPDKAYGTPQDYKEFIDLCHENGIAVILDVVFNQSDGLHPWYQMYEAGSNPFYNRTAPHAYNVLNDFNQGYPLVEKQWTDMLKFWLSEYKVDGFRFDLVKGLGDNTSYANSSGSATDAYNPTRVARMKRLHAAMKEINPDAYFINELLGSAQEENELAEDGQLNWANVNNAGCQYAMAWNSNASLNRMYAIYDKRTAGSTVAYLESHDEERLAYKQDEWGNTGVKGDPKTSMRRIGSAAAQMILTPGSHMIWMFSEMGNAQSTKSSNGDNNTGPKIVNWALLDDPDHRGLMDNYRELIGVRLANPELFVSWTGDIFDDPFKLNLGGWEKGRYIRTTTADKELYAVINPNVDGDITVATPFRNTDDSAYKIVSKSFDSNPSFDAAAKTVTVEPNCYVVLASDNVTGIEGTAIGDAAETVAIQPGRGEIRVTNCTVDVTVYTLDGATVASAKGDASFGVEPGLYIVRAGQTVAKVLVK